MKLHSLQYMFASEQWRNKSGVPVSSFSIISPDQRGHSIHWKRASSRHGMEDG